MKRILLPSLFTTALAAGLLIATAEAQFIDSSTTVTVGSFTPESRVSKIDGLLHLTPEQKAKILDLLQRQDAALARANSAEPRVPLFSIYEATLGQIRGVLTPEQLKVYDRTPQGQGGGLTIVEPEFRVKQLDKEVSLSAEQRKVALAIYTEEYESLRALPAEERSSKGIKFSRATHDQIRAILTPAQIEKQDNTLATLTARADDEINAIEKTVRSSAGVAGRVGPNLTLQRMGRSTRNPNGDRVGEARFKATGDTASEFITVYWERKPATAPLKVTKITDAHNVVIGP